MNDKVSLAIVTFLFGLSLGLIICGFFAPAAPDTCARYEDGSIVCESHVYDPDTGEWRETL